MLKMSLYSINKQSPSLGQAIKNLKSSNTSSKIRPTQAKDSNEFKKYLSAKEWPSATSRLSCCVLIMTPVMGSKPTC